MVFKEDLSDLYFAFNDRLKEDGKEEKIITCKICCLEVPAHSTRSEVCEMCFDVDFWDHQKEEAKKRVDTMWAIKVTKSGIIGKCYYHKDNYWAGRREDGVASLGGALLYKTKNSAQEILSIMVNILSISQTKECPEFKMVQIQLSEI